MASSLTGSQPQLPTAPAQGLQHSHQEPLTQRLGEICLPAVCLSVVQKEITSQTTPRGHRVSWSSPERQSGYKEMLSSLSPGVRRHACCSGQTQLHRLLPQFSLKSWVTLLVSRPQQSSLPLENLSQMFPSAPHIVSFLVFTAQFCFPTTTERFLFKPGSQGPVLALGSAHGDLQSSDHLRYQQSPEVPPHSSSRWPTSGPVFSSRLPPHPACSDQHQQSLPAPGPHSGQGGPGWRGHGHCDT